MVVKATQLGRPQHTSQHAPTRELEGAWATGTMPDAGVLRARPFPHTDLRRVQLLGILDAMVNAGQPPPMYALYEVLSILERYHLAGA